MLVNNRTVWYLALAISFMSGARLYGQIVGVPKPPASPVAANGPKFPPRSGGYDFPNDKVCWTSCTRTSSIYA